MEQARELLDLLQHSQLKVRKGAVEIALGLTGSPDGKELLNTIAAHTRIARLVGDDDETVAGSAVQTLINLTEDNNTIASDLLKHHVIPKLMDALRDPSCKYRRDAVLLLVNLTQTDEGCEHLLRGDTVTVNMVGHNLRRLIQILVASADNSNILLSNTINASSILSTRDTSHNVSTTTDPLEHIAHIIANMTRLKEAREILLEPERRILPALFPQLTSRSEIRRFGIASTLRNCCFEVEERHINYFLSPSVDLIPTLVYPLAGPATPYTANDIALMPSRLSSCDEFKRRETHTGTRRALMEALLLLASNKLVRDHMRTIRVYPIIKSFHEYIESDSNPHYLTGSNTNDSNSNNNDDDDDKNLCPDDKATVEAINKLVQQFYRTDEVPDVDPKDLRLEAPPTKTIKPTVELATAETIAKEVAYNTKVTEEELTSVLTPSAGAWDDTMDPTTLSKNGSGGTSNTNDK